VRRPFVVLAVVAAIVIASIGFGYWVRGPSVVLNQATAGPTSSAEALRTAPPAPTAPPDRTGLPNPALTPGAVNPNVRPDNLDDTICKAGWTKTVRPPSAYTGALKIAQIIEYGYADKNRSHYQEDHLVPLELGGAPRDPRNLWPQPLSATLPDGTAIGADEKDDLEDELKRRVCAGTVGLDEAQRAIAGDWVQAWIDAGRP
jgi:hypothetical protein